MPRSLLTPWELQCLLDVLDQNKHGLSGARLAKGAQELIFLAFQQACPYKITLTQAQLVRQCDNMIARHAIEEPGNYTSFSKLGKNYIRPPIGTAQEDQPRRPGKGGRAAKNDSATAPPRKKRRAMVEPQTSDNISATETETETEIDTNPAQSIASSKGMLQERPRTPFLDDRHIKRRVMMLSNTIELAAGAFQDLHSPVNNLAEVLDLIGTVSGLEKSMKSWTFLHQRRLATAFVSQAVFHYVLDKEPVGFDKHPAMAEDLTEAMAQTSTTSPPPVQAVLQRMTHLRLRRPALRSLEIPAKAAELAGRLESSLRLLFRPGTSLPTKPPPPEAVARLPAPPIFAQVFEEAMILRLDLALKGVPTILTWPQPGEKFDGDRMKIDNLVLIDPERSVVCFALSPLFSRALEPDHPLIKMIGKEAVIHKAVVYLEREDVDTHFLFD